jgi:glycosyltransferase involved in cell wall biosynthesis
MTSTSGGNDRLRILHVIVMLDSGNSQFNEHSLPVMDERDLTLCTYFEPKIVPPPQIRLFAGDGSLRGFLRVLRQALRAGEYDAVHVHSPHTSFLFVVAMLLRFGRGLRRRSVYTVHDSFYDFKPRNKLLMIPGLAVFSRVVFCSHAAYESLPAILKRLVGSRARVVQNGVDIARIDRVIAATEPSYSETFSVLSIGRIEPVKDPVALVRAFAQSGGDDDTLVFVGEGGLRSELEEAIGEAGLGDRVTLTGQIEREEVFRRLLGSDVFISTSHGEGLPVAVMESMACSIPVILSDIPPHREFAADPEIIPLVPMGDVAGFARELARFRSMSDDERAAIGRACRELVATGFSLDRMTEGYEAIYRETERVGSKR